MNYKPRCEKCGQYKSKTYQKSLEKVIESLKDRIKYLEGKEFYMSIRKDIIHELTNQGGRE